MPGHDLDGAPHVTRTIVIGGGIAGLATAGLLAREGHEVMLLEQRESLGGRAGSLKRGGFSFDTGPSWYLMPGVFDHFFALMGTSTAEQLDLRDLNPAYRVFSEPNSSGTLPNPVTIPRGAQQVRDIIEDLEPGSAKVLTDYLDSARHTTDMAEKYFLYNPFTRITSLLNWSIIKSLPKLGRLLLTPLDSYVAHRFKHPVLRQVLGYPAVFLGTNPSAAPAMYHLMSALDLEEGVQYPIGGFTRVVDRIAALTLEAGATLVTGAEVIEITTEDASSHLAEGNTSARNPWSSRRSRAVTGVRWRDKDGNEHQADAEVVVSGADLHHTETKLLHGPERSYPERWWQRRTSGPGAVLVMLGVQGELPELPHHSLFFTRSWKENFEAIFGKYPVIPEPASIYVCRPSATEAQVAPPGSENLFVLVPIPADPSFGGGGADGLGDPRIEQVADSAIDQIATWANIPDLRSRITVRQTIGPADFAREYHSWSGGMLGPAHTLRQSAMFRPQNQSKRVVGLYYAGATTAPGVGVPMCLISAELVLKRIRGDHSAGPTAPRMQEVN